MNDNATLTKPAQRNPIAPPSAPAEAPRLAALLPYATLALSLAAFNVGLPAKLAHGLRAQRHAEAENIVRDEPAVFPMPSAALPEGFRRGIHDILGRGFSAIR